MSQSEQPRGTIPYPYPIIVTSSSPKNILMVLLSRLMDQDF